VNKNPTDATVCRYLFTAELLYMFRVSQHPSSGVLKTVPAASGTGHTTCTATPHLRGLIWTGLCNFSASSETVHLFKLWPPFGLLNREVINCFDVSEWRTAGDKVGAFIPYFFKFRQTVLSKHFLPQQQLRIQLLLIVTLKKDVVAPYETSERPSLYEFMYCTIF